MSGALGWQELGLRDETNYQDNGVHASASPLEGLAERMNWLQLAPRDDGFGMALLGAGVPEGTIKAWSVDPQVALEGGLCGGEAASDGPTWLKVRSEMLRWPQPLSQRGEALPRVARARLRRL